MSTAIVTGGSRGIGRNICIELAKRGYDIITCYASNSAAADETIELCKAEGVNGLAKKVDVSKAEEVEAFVAEIKAQFGSIDVLVNNAGITRDGLLIRMSEDDFNSVLNTNLGGTFIFTKAVVKEMMRAKKGSIINISSVVGTIGNAGQANYAASKAAIEGFTKSVAKEYGGKGVRVNAVAPGFIATDMTDSLPDEVKKNYLAQIPLKKFGEPSVIAKAVAFLASDDAEYITGQTIHVDGGLYM